MSNTLLSFLGWTLSIFLFPSVTISDGNDHRQQPESQVWNTSSVTYDQHVVPVSFKWCNNSFPAEGAMCLIKSTKKGTNI